MKRLIPFLFVIATCVGWVHGQAPSQPAHVVLTNTAPSGRCSADAAGMMVFNTGVVWTCQNGVWTSVGGGGTIPSTTLVLKGDGAGNAAAASGQDEALTAIPAAANTNFEMSTTNPASTTIIQNTLVGKQVGGNLIHGSGFGGEANVFMGYLAGQSATTMRESVLIGANAGINITGNNSGPDDMIFTCIGSNTCDGLTNLGGGSVAIGQKAMSTATSSTADVFIGVHSGTAITTSIHSVAIGALAAGDVVASLADTTTIGSSSMGGEGICPGAKNQDTAVGSLALSNICAANDNTVVGYAAGHNLTTGAQNLFLGSSAGVGIVTGNANIALGYSSASQLTSGSNNFLAGPGGTVSTGDGNFVFGNANTGGNATGNDNVMIGRFVGQSTGNVSNDVFIGFAAGNGATSGSQTFVGQSSGRTVTSGASNTGFGSNSLRFLTTGSNNTAVGDSALNLITGAESGDVGIGSGAEVALGVSNAVQIGAGTNSTTGTAQIFSTQILNAAGFIPTASLDLIPRKGTITFTTATSDAATISGVTSSSNCVAFPTNSTAAATTVAAFISAVGTNSVTISHVATTASGGTMNIHCLGN